MKRHKVYTLEIEKTVRRHLTAVKEEADVSAEVDFDLTGFIYEIRVWSDFANEFLPVDSMWFLRNCYSKYKEIETAVRNKVEEVLFPIKQFNNDDPNPAA